jgi:putative protease
MAKQKFRPARLGGFSGAKAYIRYVEVLKKRRNAAGRTFCNAINVSSFCFLRKAIKT